MEQQSNSSAIGTQSFANDVPLLFGTEVGNSIFMNALLDDIRFWQAALSETAISSDMTAIVNGTEANLIAAWDFESDDAYAPDTALIGYTKGVPMGGYLDKNEGGGAPSFLLQAFKDPDGANLDRAQIVKGWVDATGVAQERVFDVALSDQRTVDKSTGKAAKVQSTVNVKEATYSNSVGAVSFSTVWEDPDFHPTQRAFYYARVIEIPTPRWTAYDAKYFQQAQAESVPMTTQERVYSSPIWYRP